MMGPLLQGIIVTLNQPFCSHGFSGLKTNDGPLLGLSQNLNRTLTSLSISWSTSWVVSIRMLMSFVLLTVILLVPPGVILLWLSSISPAVITALALSVTRNEFVYTNYISIAD